MPGNAIVDPSTIEGSSSVDMTASSTETQSGVVVFTAPRSVRSTDSLRCKLVLSSFKCHRSSGDGFFNGKDELYWCTSAGADSGKEATHRTGEFGSLKSGDTRWFQSNAVLFDGEVEEHLAGHIQCWEADDSGDTGTGAAILALIAIVFSSRLS